MSEVVCHIFSVLKPSNGLKPPTRDFVAKKPDVIPSLKLTASLPLKMDGWKTKFPFGSLPIFRGFDC